MASYVDTTLIKDERVLHRGQLSLWSLAGHIAGGIILLPVFGLGLILLTIAWIRYHSTELAVTNKRLITKTGFIRRETVELNLLKVESMEVHQGVWGRMLDFGSLKINGTGASHTPLDGIRDPLAFRRIFMEAQDQAQQQLRGTLPT